MKLNTAVVLLGYQLTVEHGHGSNRNLLLLGSLVSFFQRQFHPSFHGLPGDIPHLKMNSDVKLY